MSFLYNTESFVKLKQSVHHLKIPESIFKHRWTFDADDLANVVGSFQEPESAMAKLAQMGGIPGLMYALRTDGTTGIDADEFKDVNEDGIPEGVLIRQDAFGKNEIPHGPSPSFLELCYEQLQDPMLIVLVVAGVVSIIVGAIENPTNGWTEGVAVLGAVCIVVFIGGLNDYQKEQQFREMEVVSSQKQTMVVRHGETLEIDAHQVVVGDLVYLRQGYTVPCDGIYVHGTDNLSTDESSLTGEIREVKKNARKPFILGGTQVMMGEGVMLTVAVGVKTEWGKLMAGLSEERDETPLQAKLGVLAQYIGWGGAGAAIALFIILLITWGITEKGSHPEEILTFFIIAVTIVVVAVPEGLPLAVTISLAYSMKKMLSDNNFVRHLSACETMGNATTICSDKTGTLTQNKMTVVKLYLARRFWGETMPEAHELQPLVQQTLSQSICTNSKATMQVADDGSGREYLAGGNQTECALVQWMINLGVDYVHVRQSLPTTKFYSFDSTVKRSSVLIHTGDKYVMYVKGAAEQVLGLCDSIMNYEGEAEQFDEKEDHNDRHEIIDHLDKMTRVGLRCLGLCYREYHEDEIPFKPSSKTEIDEDKVDLFTNMTWIGVCGIKDPVRPEVPGAVKTIQNAGVVVRMVTGDHLETAKFIARECGILTCSDHVCMLGAEFRTLSDDQKMDILPRLRVLARSKPSDKEALVTWYKNVNADVVAVTGDGANDALALKQADVGLSMGIQGTDVAKEASDIIIEDDNFASIEATLMWGRSVYDNIRKFVQFQLTVNVVALTLTLVAAFVPDKKNPLNAVQLLWVNLIMDTMAALALATEQPTLELLTRHPFAKDASLISKMMWRFVFGHSLMQLGILFMILFAGENLFNIKGAEHYDSHCVSPSSGIGKKCQNRTLLTMVFNTFVWFQIFNELNARKVSGEWNILDRLFDNYYFVGIIIFTVILQALIVEFGGTFVNTYSLSPTLWAYCIGFGAISIPWNQLVRLVPVDEDDGYIEFDKVTAFRMEPGFDLTMTKHHTESEFADTMTGKRTVSIPVEVAVSEAR